MDDLTLLTSRLERALARCNCRCRSPNGWADEHASIMRRTADVDPELLRSAEIRALTEPS